MSENKGEKLVTPPLGKRVNYNLRVVLVGIVGAIGGALVLFFFVAFLLPGFRENIAAMGIIACILTPVAFSINYFFSIRKSKRMIEWMKADVRGAPIPEQLVYDAKECAVSLPRISATLSIILWPSAMIAMALTMFFLGRFGWYQTVLAAISGLLIGPLNALAYFYGLRRVIHGVLKRINDYPIPQRIVEARMVSLRFKLIFSFTCLVLCPMLFAVILDRHQGEKIVTRQRIHTNETILKNEIDLYINRSSRDAIEKYISSARISNSHYFAVDAQGKLISGDAPEKYRREALTKIYKGAMGTLYLPRSNRLLTAYPIGGGDIWVMAVYYRLNDAQGFWARNWLIAALFMLLGGYGIYLGRESSLDIMRSVNEMIGSSAKVKAGDFAVRGVYLNDDELGELGEVFNKLLDGIKSQLEISGRMVSDIRATIASLSKGGDEVYSVVSRQRMGVGDQMMGLSQAQSVAGQITDAARTIQEKAGEIKNMADRTSGDCATSRDVLDGAVNGMRLIGSSMEEISGEMNKLMAHYKTILEVVKLIEEINERTDLLSMNASLEAVGAKKLGKRFAVVAQEVRRLADKTAQSTNKIQSLFNAIQESSGACINALKAGDERSTHGLEMMEQLNKSFLQILENAQSTGEAVAQIHFMTTQQTTACLQMQDTISDVADAGKVVEEGADTTEQTVRSLSGLTTNLQALVKSQERKS